MNKSSKIFDMNMFGDWLRLELEVRGYSQTRFAKRIGVEPGTISNWVNGRRDPSAELCRKIADVFLMPPEHVLRKAGILPPLLSTDKANITILIHLMEQLPEDEQLELIAIAELKVRRHSRD